LWNVTVDKNVYPVAADTLHIAIELGLAASRDGQIQPGLVNVKGVVFAGYVTIQE
jgi:hypothetical protein